MDIPIEIRRAVYQAVDAGDVEKFRKAVAKAPAVLRGGWSGGDEETFLHLAARKGQTEICAAIVKLGAEIDTPDPDTFGTALQTAAESGRLATARWLLDHGACVDGLAESISTPLMAAAVEGSVELSRLFLDKGADVNREHLRFPETALDIAVAFKVKGSGQEAVAALLRQRGGISPYRDDHDWDKVPGREYIQYIEGTIGSVNPIALTADAGRGRKITVRKAVVAPTCEFKVLFTVGIARAAGAELGLVLPWGWPLNRESLAMPRFNWPLTLLGRLAGFAGDGKPLAHGTLVEAGHPALKTVAVPADILQWLVVKHSATDVKRETEPPTLLVIPMVAKKPVASSAAKALADKTAKAKWKALALPLPAPSQHS